MEVQREIVRILDDFTRITEELKENLRDELIARQKQYEYYRDLLLTFVESDGTLKQASKQASKQALLK